VTLLGVFTAKVVDVYLVPLDMVEAGGAGLSQVFFFCQSSCTNLFVEQETNNSTITLPVDW